MKKFKSISLLIFCLSSLFFSIGCDDVTSSNDTINNDFDSTAIITSNLVNVAWLNANINNDGVKVIDARGIAGSYISGAMATTWQNFANVTVTTTEIGFGELLSASEVCAKIADLGIEATDTVVVYAAAGAGWGEAGRIVWMLQMAGIEAKILDGGINAWTTAGYSTSTEATTLTASTFSLTTLDEAFTISTDSLNANKASIIILDTRSKAEFDGDTASYGALDGFTHGGWGEKAFGHIPGAIHAPFTDLFQSDGTLKSTADLEALVATWGLTDKNAVIAPYCTGGIRSAYMAIVLRELGYINAVNYDASFYGWTAADLSVINPSSTVGAMTDNLVNVAWLKNNISNENVVIIDARDYSSAYILSHIQGAISTQWQLFAKVDITTTEIGFGELLSASEVGAKIADLGIEATDTVVVYAAAGAGWGEAGRIVWMLQMAGIEAKILDGGINAWTTAGYSTSTEATTLTASTFSLTTLDEAFTISTDSLNANKASIIILDTRSKAEFDGDTASYGALDGFTHGGWGEKAFGHIPGAIHAPFTDLFQSDGTLKSTTDLEALVATWGLTDKNAVIAPYCTGGIRSAYMAIVLRELGYINAVNYDASFYGWTAADFVVD